MSYLDEDTRTDGMSYVSQDDIMVHSVDLDQHASGYRLRSNQNYDSFDTVVTDVGEHYETLNRNGRRTECASGTQSQPIDTNNGRIAYTQSQPIDTNNGRNAYTQSQPIDTNNGRNAYTQSQPIDTNNGRNAYTRYIRPCEAFSNRCEINSRSGKSSMCLTSRTLKKLRSAKIKYTARHVILSFVCGLVFGLVLSSVCWLTVDRLKGTEIICKFDKNGQNNDDEIANFTTAQRKTTTEQKKRTTLGKRTTSTSLFSKPSDTTTEGVLLNTATNRQVSTASISEKNSTNLRTLFSEITAFPTSASKLIVQKDIKSKTRKHISTTSTPKESQNGDIFSNQSFSSPGGHSYYTSTSEPQLAQQSSTTSSYSKENNNFNTSMPTLFSSTVTASVPTASNENLSTSGGSSSTTSQVSLSPQIISGRNAQGGHVYIRWGSLSCPLETDQLYKGYAASGHWQHSGGATNMICLPEAPTWSNYSDGNDADRNLVYGTEYGSSDASFSSVTGIGENLRNKDVPCSVCQATGRLSHVMIPGMKNCILGWTQEYRGYLMGSGYIHSHASELICVDSSPDHVTNTDVVKGGNFLYFAEVRSGSLPSSAYPNGREIACVVCTL